MNWAFITHWRGRIKTMQTKFAFPALTGEGKLNGVVSAGKVLRVGPAGTFPSDSFIFYGRTVTSHGSRTVRRTSPYLL